MNYTTFIEQHPKGHIMQTDLWAQLKSNWKHETLTATDGHGAITGAMSVLIQKLPGLPYSMLYSPRGPVCDPHDEQTLEKLTESAKALAKKHRAYVLKIDPDIESSDTVFCGIMEKLGYKLKKTGKNFEGIQPKYVFRLNVEGKTEDEVFASFKNKWRYNIRVAIKKGVEVKVGTREDLARFHEIMLETGLRDQFVVRSLEYFERMYDVFAPEYLRLYCAYHEGKMIAGTIAMYYGDKVWYMYGASSNEARNVMPNYLLQWEMIRWAIEKNCRIYDFRGVSGDIDESNPLYGLYRFKQGFNGTFTEFVGEYELAFKPVLAACIDKGSHAFIELRRRLFVLRGKKD